MTCGGVADLQVAPSQPLPREEVEEPQAGPGVVRVQVGKAH